MLNAAAVALQLGISRRAVYDLAKRGHLACHRLGVGGGAVRFAPDDIEAYLQSCRSAGTPETSAGATNSTVSLRAADTDLAGYFQKAGVKPKLTPTTERSRGGSTRLRLASSSPSR
jgi:excisionase family DNA binding protein